MICFGVMTVCCLFVYEGDKSLFEFKLYLTIVFCV